MADHNSAARPGPVARRIPPELRVEAIERLMTTPDRARAARRLIDSAGEHGIDLDLLWGTVEGAAGRQTVMQSCLAVPAAGRTAMLFLSAPGARQGPPGVQQRHLTETVRTALAELPRAVETPLSIAQALVEPHHEWALGACRDAGMTWVGRLQFMQLPWAGTPEPDPAPWPDGVTVRSVTDPTDFTPGGDGHALATALERTYAGTLDCPELCGLRSTRDVIDSHMATGRFDPARWWIVRLGGEPHGCCLLSHCPTNCALELVYLGVSPALRGQRMGERLLRHALAHANADVREVTCAVDTRNTPALRLYQSMGFRPFGARVGFVAPLRAASVEIKVPSALKAGGKGGTLGTSGGQENVAIAKRL